MIVRPSPSAPTTSHLRSTDFEGDFIGITQDERRTLHIYFELRKDIFFNLEDLLVCLSGERLRSSLLLQYIDGPIALSVRKKHGGR